MRQWVARRLFTIKSNGGGDTFSNVILQDFILRGTIYGLYIDQYWSCMLAAPGNGAKLNNITLVVSTETHNLSYNSLSLSNGIGMVAYGWRRRPPNWLHLC